MPDIKLYLLGAPRLEAGGKPVAVDTRKAIALAAYLAVTCRPHSRDALAALLWPEYERTRAYASLRRTLSVLHAALGGQGLLIERESVALDEGAGVWTDVGAFDRRLAECRSHGHAPAATCPRCVEPLTAAAGLYRDDFLAGFSLRDSSAFDDWQFFQAEHLRRELSGALERLVRAHSSAGDFEPAIQHARRWLALDSLHEPAHRQLMLLYAWTGEHAAALRQYQECARVLEQELGVPPLEETTALFSAIKAHRPPPAPVAAPVPAAPESPTRRPGTYPLVGRAAEWASLLRTYDSVRTPSTPQASGRWIVLEGEAGIGKTRLAEALLDHVRRQGATAITARCYAGEAQLAYGPFVEGLRAATTQPPCPEWLMAVPAHWLAEAARLLPELHALRGDLPAVPPLDSPGAQGRFFEGVYQLLLGRCAGAAAPVVFLDDLHWADEASLDLLAYLVQRLPRYPLCIVTTWRGEDVPPSHRLRSLLAGAQRAGTATQLRLGRLNAADLVELARAALPAAGDAAKLGRRLYQETEGLPFFVIEYLAALTQGDGPIASDAAWSLPGGVRDLLQSRLAAVSETGGQLLHTAAVLGRSFDFDLLRDVSGRGDDEVVAGLEELVARGLVAEVPAAEEGSSPLYDFGHEKLRALAYEQISLARRRLLHRRAADALAVRARARRQAGELAGQIAWHYRLSGRDVEAAEHYRLAGEHARALYAGAEALAHFRAALALGHPEVAALHEAIGDLLTLSADYGGALAGYAAAIETCAPDQRALLEHKQGGVYQRRGEWDLAERHFEAANAALGTDGAPALRARLLSDWSLLLYHSGHAARAADLAEQALALAEAAGDARGLAQAHNLLGMLAHHNGDLDGARRHLERSLALAETLEDPGARVAALNNLALACGAAGDLPVAIETAGQALALCAALGDRHREAALHNNLADLLHAGGQTEAAMAHLKQAVTIFAEIGSQAGALQPEIWKLSEW